MTWSLFRWIWLLESPLHVGTVPAGSLNRCRLYVPARVLWGALTAELARRQAKGFPGYQDVGKKLQEKTRFTYLYPAKQVGGDWRAWLPRYKNCQGLIWQREDRQDGSDSFPDRQMRMRLLWTRSATAIEHSTTTAAEGTLRESEHVNPHWKEDDETVGPSVAFVGYVFFQDGTELKDALAPIDQIAIGGDTRYGLGRIRRIAMTQADSIFGAQAQFIADDPIVPSRVVYAHAKGPVMLVGSLEMLVGWDNASGRGPAAQDQGPLWVPGSVVKDGSGCRWKVDEHGLWEVVR